MNSQNKHVDKIKWIFLLFLAFSLTGVACSTVPKSETFADIDNSEFLADIDNMVQRGSISLLTWSPDGKTITVTVNFAPVDSNPIMWAGGKVPAPFSEIFFIDIESRTVTSFYKEEGTMFYASNWSPDSKKIVVVSTSQT
jgi:Tol biopolymer transport system component